MQLASLLALASLAASVLGFVVPVGTPDGFYIATHDGEGNLVHRRITNVTLPDSPPTRRSPRPPRGLGPLNKRMWYTSGPTGNTFPIHADYDYCTDYWRNFLSSGYHVARHSINYCVRNWAVLAGCNYRTDDAAKQVEGAQMIDDFNSFMDATYGYWRTGWRWMGPPNFSFWRDVKGAQICTNL